MQVGIATSHHPKLRVCQHRPSVERIDLELSGPYFDRALLLAREAATTVVLGGGEGWEAALEPILTEMANNRVIGVMVGLVLTTLAARAATAAVDAELAVDGVVDPSLEFIAHRAAELIQELLDGVSAAAGS